MQVNLKKEVFEKYMYF